MQVSQKIKSLAEKIGLKFLFESILISERAYLSPNSQNDYQELLN